MHTDRDEDLKAGELPGKRFRAERLRMGMSSLDVAHICGAMESTVFNREAGRSRIPLHAAEKRWPHGFDPERLVSRSVETELVRDPGGVKWPVPRHLLRRCRLEKNTALVYNNPWRVAELLLAGEGCLTDGGLDLEELTKTPLIVVFRHPKADTEFVCEVSLQKKMTARLSLGKVEGKVSLGKLPEEWDPRGSCRCRIGNEPPGRVRGSHEEGLRRRSNWCLDPKPAFLCRSSTGRSSGSGHRTKGAPRGPQLLVCSCSVSASMSANPHSPFPNWTRHESRAASRMEGMAGLLRASPDAGGIRGFCVRHD